MSSSILIVICCLVLVSYSTRQTPSKYKIEKEKIDLEIKRAQLEKILKDNK